MAFIGNKRIIGRFSAMNGEIQAAHEDATRIVKKQRICAENTAASLHALIALVSEAQQRMQRGDGRDAEAVKRELEQLQTAIESEEWLKSMNKDTRDLHAAISKLGKVYLELPHWPTCHSQEWSVDTGCR